MTQDIVYLALGDSYTIGTGASHESRNFPSLLAQRLEAATARTVQVVNPAVNGFTTLDVLAREIGYIKELEPDLVTVLIGVNDLVQGRTVSEYRGSLIEIYESVARLGLETGRVAAISIPEWSVVPAARNFGDAKQIGAATESFNAVARAEAVERGFVWVDITAASVGGLGSPGWIASDHLHPGDAQYSAWAEAIWTVVGEGWAAVARP